MTSKLEALRRAAAERSTVHEALEDAKSRLERAEEAVARAEAEIAKQEAPKLVGRAFKWIDPSEPNDTRFRGLACP